MHLRFNERRITNSSNYANVPELNINVRNYDVHLQKNHVAIAQLKQSREQTLAKTGTAQGCSQNKTGEHGSPVF